LILPGLAARTEGINAAVASPCSNDLLLNDPVFNDTSESYLSAAM